MSLSGRESFCPLVGLVLTPPTGRQRVDGSYPRVHVCLTLSPLICTPGYEQHPTPCQSSQNEADSVKENTQKKVNWEPGQLAQASIRSGLPTGGPHNLSYTLDSVRCRTFCQKGFKSLWSRLFKNKKRGTCMWHKQGNDLQSSYLSCTYVDVRYPSVFCISDRIF